MNIREYLIRPVERAVARWPEGDGAGMSIVVVVELETTTAPGQPTPTDETSRLGCVCYTTMTS